MDRKGIIGVTIAMLVLLVWQIEFAPKFMPPPPTAAQAAAAASAAPAASATTTVSSAPVGLSPTGVTTPAPGTPGAPSSVDWPFAAFNTPQGPEQITRVSESAVDYQFTNLGGGIARAQLNYYPAESGSNVGINGYGTLPIGALSETWGAPSNLPYKVTVQGNTVTCTRDDPGGLSITKRFTLPTSINSQHGYGVTLDITFANHGAKPISTGSNGYYLYLGSAAPIHQNDLATYTAFDWNASGNSQHADAMWFSGSKVPLLDIQIRPERSVYTAEADKIDWASDSSQYFTTIFTAQAGTAGTGVWAQRLPLYQADGSKIRYAIQGGLRVPLSLAPGQSVTHSFSIYAGPKIYGVLKGMGGGQERIITTYFSFWGMAAFRPVSIFLLNTMNLLHSWTGSYAIAIILLTLCIRGALWPIQNKATASMRQMQELNPRMTELKEKYKDDPARMNTEVMKLYKEYNVNPLAGCLPMFIQIPIFFGFYRVLGTAIELRGSHFLWVHDLSQPDTVFHIAGYPVNILPICMAITMIMQMQLQPKTGDQAQQRMFMFLPLIFVMFCYNFASALALYWTVQNIFSITQLYLTRKRTAPAPFKAVAKRKTR
jgi:YidC/Oxa1 family membrane protein insertase